MICGRVEISAEQLGQASSKAEQMGKECGRELRIIGWYHSHPHITVWPSHVGQYVCVYISIKIFDVVFHSSVCHLKMHSTIQIIA